MNRSAVYLALLAVALMLSSCGSDEQAKPVEGSPANPLVASRAGETTTSGGAVVPPGEPGAKASGKPNYKALVDRQRANPAERFTPCNLVTQREAEAIMGRLAEPPVEAQQGPTCIFRSADSRRLITVAVHETDFKTIRDQIGDLRRVRIAGRRAFCGTLGQPTLYVPLAEPRVLSVTGGCRTARAFASKALRRL